jgi:branched-chain amino acid transport system substrate-binding protein
LNIEMAMRDRTPVVVGAFGALALACAVIAAPLHAKAAPVRIGLSLPLTGNAALLGQQFLEGAKLSLADHAGGREIELVTVDDGCDAKLASLAAEELRDAGVALVAGLLCNEAVAPIATALADRAIPLLLSGARSSRLLKDTAKEGWPVLRLAQDENRAALFAFEVLSKRWAATPWAVIDDGSVAGRLAADELRSRMEEAGLSPVLADSLRPAQSTQASVVRRLVKAGAQAVYVAADAEDSAILWQNINGQDAKIEMVGAETISLLPYLPLAGDTTNGLLAILEADPVAMPQAGALNARLEREGIEPEAYLFFGYAALQVALASLGDTPKATLGNLKKGEFATIYGPVSFDETGQNIRHTYSLKEWKDGVFADLPPTAQ